MELMVLDTDMQERLIAERQASGGDRFDEVWEGVYMMAPLANNEHQDLQARLAGAIRNAVGWGSPVRVQAGANVSDREHDWAHNYRCPDVVVVMPGGTARDCGTHWHGGPDFCAEITSAGDRSRAKLEFYAGIGVRELLLIDRAPWQLELYRLSTTGELELVAESTTNDPARVASAVIPLAFRLLPAQPRPHVEVAHNDGVQRWLV